MKAKLLARTFAFLLLCACGAAAQPTCFVSYPASLDCPDTSGDIIFSGPVGKRFAIVGVYLDKFSGGSEWATNYQIIALPDRDGSFSFGRLPEGRYRLNHYALKVHRLPWD